ncbi:MAG: pyruvate kinase [Actinomycetota bacterium]
MNPPTGDRPRTTKLICTIGPASAGCVGDLVRAGMDIARVNFSHGTDNERRAMFASIRAAADEAGREVGILADLSGPKVRLREVPGDRMELAEGSRLTLGEPDGAGEGDGGPCIATGHPGLAHDVRPGDTVFLADGAVELRVLHCDGAVVTEVVRGGTVRSRAGVNVPSSRLSLPAVTTRDEADLARAVELGCDLVAQSFVRRADDVRRLRQCIGDLTPRIVAKIETRGALEEFDGILANADGVILARGDLGVELPFELVPLIQKDLIGRARRAGVPGVVATQLLLSMCSSPRPTRAEANDVANAVFDGADGVLLSDETAVGRHPVGAAEAAVRILETADRWMGSPEAAPTDGPDRPTLRRLA